jgi:hypothetical protein
MHALTYWHPVPELKSEAGLRQAWERNWTQLGWQTYELGLVQAAAHPRYESFVMKARTWPTINPLAYEEACWVRWLALDQWLQQTGEPGAVLSDYDVFNVTVSPERLQHTAELTTHGLVSLDGNLTCVGGVWVSSAFARIIPALLEDRAMQLSIADGKRRHISDLMVFNWLFKIAKLGAMLGWVELFEPKHKELLLTARATGTPWLLHLHNDGTTYQNMDRTALFLEMEKILWP